MKEFDILVLFLGMICGLIIFFGLDQAENIKEIRRMLDQILVTCPN
jgi:hypothetical protein